MKRLFCFALLVLVVGLIAGCGSSTAPIAITFSLSGTQLLDNGQTVNISVTVMHDNSGKGVMWSLTGPGALTSTTTSATYMAPSSGAGTATITATSIADSSKTATLMVTVSAPPAITTTSLSNGIVGVAYSQTVMTTGGAGTLTFSLASGTLPAGLTLSSAGAITGMPTTVGTSNFTVKVADASTVSPQSATKALSITVNQAPAITSTNGVTFVVGTAGTFTVTATGTPTPTLTETGALPSGVTFVDKGNGTGTLSGTPAAGTAANYAIMFTASNGVGTAATQNFTLTVGQPAVITSASSTTFTVGTAGTFMVTTTGFPAPALTETGALPSGVTFKDNGNGTATLSGTPGAGTGGTYTITVKAHNGIGTDATQSFTLTVDQTPAITSANKTTFTVGTAGTFTVTATGFPKPSLTETGALPSGVTFVDNGNGTGTLAGIPAPGTAANYPITFTPSNGVGSPASQTFTLTVGQPPTISSAGSTTFTVGAAGTFSVTTTGFPAPAISETGALPTGVTFTDNGNGTGTLAGTPAAGTGKTYSIMFTASNGIGSNGTQNFTLTVDQAPGITSANSTTFTVGAAGTFMVTTTGFPVPTLAETGTLPTGVTFTNNGNGTGTLSGTPASGTNGSYPITFTATNGIAPNATQSFTLTVNTAPVITSASSTTFTAGTAGTFTVTTTGTPTPSLTEAGALPSGVTFKDNGNGTGTLSGTPAAGTGGVHPITFTAANGTTPNAVQNFTLTVDQAPAFTSATSVTFSEGAAGTFTVTATGPPAPTISEAGALPSGVTFTDNGNGTATLAGTPAAGTSGSYPLVFTAANGITPNATQDFTLTVNSAPVITSGSSTTFTVGTAATFTVMTTGTPTPSLTETGPLPSGVTFKDNGNGTGTLSGTPAAGTGGTYTFTIKATSTLGSNSQTFTLTVDEAAHITSANGTAFIVNTAESFTVTATGFPVPTLSESGALPAGVTFNTANGVLSGTATATGTFPITFTAHNGIGADSVQSFTLTVTTGPTVVGTAVPFPIFAGDPATAIPITVTNDAAGDALTATLTVDSNTGLACTVATCGTLDAPTGASGSGTYSALYHPPASAGFTAQTVPTLIVSSNIPGSFKDTDFIEVDPKGARLVSLSGLPGYIVAGSALRTVTATVFNDATAPNGVVVSAVTASGYACSNATASINLCGTLGTPSGPVVSGTTSTTTFTYTPPPLAVPGPSPAPPYDKPRVQATSVADNTQFAIRAFQVNNNPAPVNTGLTILATTKFNSALAAVGAAPITVFAFIGNDTGNSRTVTWTLKDTTGTNCSPGCGTLSAQVDTGNGNTVSTQINYTPPASVPTVTGELTPTIAATSVDANTQTDSFTFTIVDGSCGTGHESLLNGSYAFLIRGGGHTAGYTAIIGSFTANGAGGITGGLWDFNQSVEPFTGQAITSAGSSYTVGTDNRVCLVLSDAVGDVLHFRGSVGTLVSNVATQGRLLLFNDNTGRKVRADGVLMKQDTTSFANSKFSGSYAFGEEGVDSSDGRFAGAGVVTSDGAGHVTNLIGDFDDAGTVTGEVTGGSGTYSVAATGRATVTTTLTVLGKTSTTNLVAYMVSSSEALMMSTDSMVAGHTIFSGELKKQTGSFTQTVLDNKDYVFHVEGLGSNGGNDTVIGQATFTTNGNATVTTDENNEGVEGTEKVQALVFTIASTGRTTITGGGGHTPILYLIDSTSGFLVDTGGSASAGYVEQQTGGPFSDASLSGLFFFGGDAPTTGAQYQSGTVTADGAGSVTGTGNHSGPNGLGSDIISPATGGTYSFSTTSTPQGKGTVGTNSIAYIISGSKLIFMNTGSDPEIFIIQK